MKVIPATARIEITSAEVDAAREESIVELIWDHLISCFNYHHGPTAVGHRRSAGDLVASPEMARRLLAVPHEIRLEFYTIMGWMSRTDSPVQDLETMVQMGEALLDTPLMVCLREDCPVVFPPLVEIIEDHDPSTPVYLDGKRLCELSDIDY